MVNHALDEMITYFGGDVRRISHALKVYGFACALSSAGVTQAEHLVIGLASVLHDIGIRESERKYNSAAGKYQELEGPPVAREIMEKIHVQPEIMDRVCYLIGNHHSYENIDGVDFQILVEADFLVNIDEDHMEKSSIEAIKRKYFKTLYGIKVLEGMYGV